MDKWKNRALAKGRPAGQRRNTRCDRRSWRRGREIGLENAKSKEGGGVTVILPIGGNNNTPTSIQYPQKGTEKCVGDGLKIL